MTFLGRGRTVATAQVAAPAASDMSSASNLLPALRGGELVGFQASFQGRTSLTLLGALIVGSILFYMWTREAQGS